MCCGHLLCAQAWAGQGETPPLPWARELLGWRGHHDILACARPCLGLTHYYKLVTFVSGILLRTLTSSGVIPVWSGRFAQGLPASTVPFHFPLLKLICSQFILSVGLRAGQESGHLVLLFLGEFWQVISFLWVSTFSVNQEKSNTCLVLWGFSEWWMWN